MRWARQVARVRRGEVYTGFRWGDRKKRDHLEDLGADGNMILKWIFKNNDGGAWSGLIWLCRIKEWWAFTVMNLRIA